MIIGAGPVGLTAAIELKRRGFDPIIIDDDDIPTPESRALAIHAPTLDIFEPCGVSEKLIAEGNKVNKMILHLDGTPVFKLDFNELPHHHPFILVLPQSRTEEILIDALEKLGVKINWHNKLISLKSNNDGFECKISVAGKTKTIQTKILIGADGAHSLVRKTLGFSFDGESLPGIWHLADVQLEQWSHPKNCAVAHIQDNIIHGFFPISESIGRFVSPHADISKALPTGTQIKKTIWEAQFKVSYRQVNTYQKGNAFLVGDAAHIHSPMGGRGMNLGIEDAAYLAWLIETGQTDKYTDYRHPTGEKVLAYTKRQTNMLVNGGRLRNFALKFVIPFALKSRFLRKKALQQLTGLDMLPPPWL